MRFLPTFLLLPVALAACGSKGAVSLVVGIEQPTVSLVDGAAGASLSGSFQLELALGPEASGSTHVTLGNFSLQTEAGAPLIEVLNLTSTPEFPIDVAKGDSQIARFTFNKDGVDRDEVCAGKVRIVGSVMDSIKGGTDPVSSDLIMPDCGAT
ncbi:MAG: hypothetical protein ABIQ16_02960 [Polyangiaceae bacterium]